MTKFLPLNLQYFSEEEPPTEPTPTGADNPDDTPVGEQKIPYDRFKQKVDEANELKRKLAAFEEAQAAAERQREEEQGEFKSLYEKTQAELERLKAEAQAATVDKLKTELLVQAGYTGEQLARARKYVNGEDEASLKASLDEVKADMPPKQNGVDPSPGNSPKQQPKQVDQTDVGVSAYERLKNLGRIRR